MKQGRVVGIDLGMAIALLAFSALIISGSVSSWESLAGTFENNIVEDVFPAFLFYMFGFRSSFVIRTALPGPKRSLRYFFVRGSAIIILGLLNYFLNDDLFLIGIGLCVLLSPVICLLHTSFLYFFMFSGAILSLIVSMGNIEDASMMLNSKQHWWEMFIFLRHDAMLPWLMFYFFGLIIGRKNFGEEKWFRYFFSSSVIFLAFSILANFLINNSFNGSYLQDEHGASRLFPFNIYLYRPAFLLMALPLCNLLLIASSLLSAKMMESKFWGGVFRIGQFHLSYLLIAITTSGLLHGTAEGQMAIASSISLAYVVLIFILATSTKDLIQNGPIEWFVQRMY